MTGKATTKLKKEITAEPFRQDLRLWGLFNTRRKSIVYSMCSLYGFCCADGWVEFYIKHYKTTLEIPTKIYLLFISYLYQSFINNSLCPESFHILTEALYQTNHVLWKVPGGDLRVNKASSSFGTVNCYCFLCCTKWRTKKDVPQQIIYLRYDHPNGLNRIHICVFYQKNKQVFFIKMWYILCFYF